MGCCCGNTVSLPSGGSAVTGCLSTGVVPKVQAQLGAGTVTIPTSTASSVTVTVIVGPVTVTAGADAAVSLPSGMTLSWGVDSCAQRLTAALAFTATQPGHHFIVSWTL